ncbi:MAG: hypothetical protein AB1898_13275 [Acidobacteriota bacterium]
MTTKTTFPEAACSRRRMPGPAVLALIWLAAGLTTTAADEKTIVVPKKSIHPWESVGEIIQVSNKTITVRSQLRISDATWSLEPGAVAEETHLQVGDEILAKGKTQPDGVFDTNKIVWISRAEVNAAATGGQVVQATDHGGPESRLPGGLGGGSVEGVGRVGYPGSDRRLPGPGTPRGGGGQRGPVGGLQSSRAVVLPRFYSGDVAGRVEQKGGGYLWVAQLFYLDNKKTSISRADGSLLKRKDLKVGDRVAITVVDEMDSKTQAIKATVVRVLE